MYLCPFVLFGHVKVRVELFSNLAHVQQSVRQRQLYGGKDTTKTDSMAANRAS